MTEKNEFDYNDINLLEEEIEIEEEEKEKQKEKEEEEEEGEEGEKQKEGEKEKEEEEGEEGEKEEEGEEDIPFIKTLQTKLGYIIKDGDKEKDYTDDENGLIEYIQDIEKELEAKSYTKVIENLPEEVKNYYNHLALGKSKNEYFENPLLDIQNIKLSDDIDLAKQIVKTRFMLSGFSEKEAKDMITTIAASSDENIINRGKSDLIYLQNVDKEEKEKAKLKIAEQKIAEEKANKEMWDNINNLVKSRKILDIEIPQNDVNKFLTYLSVPVKDGKTQHQLDAENEQLDRNLLYAFQRYKKYNLNDIIKLAINKNKVENLREKFNKTKNNQNQNNKNQNNNFDFNAM